MSNQNFGSATAVNSGGTLTGASQTVALDLNGSGGYGILITGTWVGIVLFEGTVDGTTWTALRAHSLEDTGTGAILPTIVTIDTSGTWVGVCGGLQQIRVRSSSWTSGTATVTLQGTPTRAESPAVSGDVIHGETDNGAPIKTGGRARTTQITPVATDERVDQIYSVTGAALVGGNTESGVPIAFVQDSGTSGLLISGDVSHNSSDSGKPVKIGGIAFTGVPSAVTNSFRTDAWFNELGLLQVALRDLAGDSVMDEANDAVRVNIISGGGSGGTALADESAFTEGTTQFTPVGGVFNETSTDVTEDQAAAFRMTADRRQYVTLQGNAAVAAATDPIKREDDPHTSLDAGMMALAVRRNLVVSTNPGGSNDDYSTFNVDEAGRLYVSLEGDGVVSSANQVMKLTDATSSGSSYGMNVVGRRRDASTAPVDTDGDTSPLLMDALGAVKIAGGVANDDADGASNPLKIGHLGVEHNTDPPTISADDDRVNSIANPQGMQYGATGHPNSIHTEYMTTGVQTNSILIPTVAAGSQIILFNIGAFLSKATTAAEVAVRIGFGASAVPTEPTTGNTVDGMALSHPGLAPASGVLEPERKVGGDGEELRLACDVPTDGQLTVRYDYYISTL